MTITQRILANKLDTMLNYFTVIRGVSQDGSGRQRLILKPSKRKMKKRFKEIELWVDKEHLIRKIRVVSKDGDVHELSLNEVQVNLDLSQVSFDPTIPESYTLGDRLENLLGPGLSF